MIEHIHPGDFDTWLRQAQAATQAQGADSPGPLVLDVREAHELQIAALRPAADAGFELLHIPMNTVPGALDQLDPDRPSQRQIACLCHHGGRSLRVAEYLRHQGFEHVVNISGGIEAWAAQRDPSIPRY
jgi:rhodanese-related sulfurtransferase